jgi:hypothetical protein
MESMAAAPETAMSMIGRALALAAQAEDAFRALPDAPAAARNLHLSLMEIRAALADLQPTAALLSAAYRAGRDDERAAVPQAPRALYAL